MGRHRTRGMGPRGAGSAEGLGLVLGVAVKWAVPLIVAALWALAAWGMG